MCCCINPAGPFILDTPYFFFGQSLRLLFTTSSRFSCVYFEESPPFSFCVMWTWPRYGGPLAGYFLFLGDGLNRRRHHVSAGVRRYMYSWIVPESTYLTVESRCYNMTDEAWEDLFALQLRTLDASRAYNLEYTVSTKL